MDGPILIVTDKLKYPGVIIDDKIAMLSHIIFVKSKVSNGIGIIFNATNYHQRNAVANLYHSFI